MNIRNRSLVHNEFAIARRRVYKLNGVTPNQLRALIEAVCSSIRVAALDLGLSETIFDSDRFERATMSMLESLEKGLA